MRLSVKDQLKSRQEWIPIELKYEQLELLVFGTSYMYVDRIRFVFWIHQFFMIKPGKKLGTIAVLYTKNPDILPEEVKEFYYEKIKNSTL